MTYKTFLQLKEEVKHACDLDEEEFISDDELNEYFNEAVIQCEAEIHDIYEDYFKTEEPLPLVLGQSEYTLPEGIFASKIREIIYSDGSNIYEIKKLRDNKQFQQLAEDRAYATSTQDYRYTLKNSSAEDGVKILLTPASAEASDDNVTIWHIREANRLTEDSDLCDIPEFYSYIVQYVKVKVWEKETHPNVINGQAFLENLRMRMINTLTNMIPDEDNIVNPDYSHYEEHS